MPDRPLHILSSIGDVTQKVTWSGTPFNIWTGLAKQRPVVTHNIVFSWRSSRAMGIANRLLGLTAHNPTRVGVGAALHQRRAEKVLRRIGPDADVLHLGSAHLPVRGAPGQRHYLFTDSGAFLMASSDEYIALTSEKHRREVLNRERDMAETLSGLFTTADYVANGFTRRYGLAPGFAQAVNSGLGRMLPDPPAKDYEHGHILFVSKQNFVNKGGALLLDAFEIVRASRPDATLVMIGNTKDAPQVPFIERMKTMPGVIFHDFDTPDYLSLLTGSALYAGPALDEPWGLIYVEALSVRTPIVGLATNAFPQFVQNGAHGWTAPAATSQAVAATLLEALSDPQQLAARGEAGRAHVLAEYTWDRVAERILAKMDGEAQIS